MLTSKLTKYSNVRGHAVVLLACEEALLFRRTKRASRERTSEGPSRKRGRSSDPLDRAFSRDSLCSPKEESKSSQAIVLSSTAPHSFIGYWQVRWYLPTQKICTFLKLAVFFLFLLFVYYWDGLDFQSPGSMYVFSQKFVEYPTPLDPRCRVHNYMLITFQWLRYSSWEQMINIWRWSWARKLSHFLFQFTSYILLFAQLKCSRLDLYCTGMKKITTAVVSHNRKWVISNNIIFSSSPLPPPPCFPTSNGIISVGT